VSLSDSSLFPQGADIRTLNSAIILLTPKTREDRFKSKISILIKEAIGHFPGGGRKGVKMERKILVLLGLVILLLKPTLALSDCVDLKRSTGWYVQGAHTIIFYDGNRPLAAVDVWNCTVNPSSDIRLLQNYVCDADKIVVDGEKCNIMTVYSASGRTY